MTHTRIRCKLLFVSMFMSASSCRATLKTQMVPKSVCRKLKAKQRLIKIKKKILYIESNHRREIIVPRGCQISWPESVRAKCSPQLPVRIPFHGYFFSSWRNREQTSDLFFKNRWWISWAIELLRRKKKILERLLCEAHNPPACRLWKILDKSQDPRYVQTSHVIFSLFMSLLLPSIRTSKNSF